MTGHPGNPQVIGLADLEGTYIFDLRTSHRALRLNRFFWNMIKVEYRENYLKDPELAMAGAKLTEEEKVMVRERDWLSLVQYGANFFVIEKFARVAQKTNLEVYAMMRGETFEEFMLTRNVPDAR